jgi:hypothetical protein
MKIVIKYAVSRDPHMIDLNMGELEQLINSCEFFVSQVKPNKSLQIFGNADELELLGKGLLSRSKELRQQKK